MDSGFCSMSLSLLVHWEFSRKIPLPWHRHRPWYQCRRPVLGCVGLGLRLCRRSYPTDLQSLALWLLLKSSSPTVFMELCFVVSVVSRSSPRPCKEPHHRAAQPHCAPTTIPELTHLSSSSMSELQIYVLDPTGHEEDRRSRFGFVLWLQTVVFSFVVEFTFIKKLLL